MLFRSIELVSAGAAANAQAVGRQLCRTLWKRSRISVCSDDQATSAHRPAPLRWPSISSHAGRRVQTGGLSMDQTAVLQLLDPQTLTAVVHQAVGSHTLDLTSWQLS